MTLLLTDNFNLKSYMNAIDTKYILLNDLFDQGTPLPPYETVQQESMSFHDRIKNPEIFKFEAVAGKHNTFISMSHRLIYLDKNMFLNPKEKLRLLCEYMKEIAFYEQHVLKISDILNHEYLILARIFNREHVLLY